MPPNILLITVDQLRRDGLGCYGDQLPERQRSTPWRRQVLVLPIVLATIQCVFAVASNLANWAVCMASWGPGQQSAH